tara:strand:+ start:827 stop:2383 length:1557 start_codon:yes stop_codon:yes gene_type:complete
MNINKTEINNFYSLKDVKVDFDKYSGLVLLEGKNKDTKGSNGSGKSALIEAVTWCLFGSTIRKSSNDDIINNLAGKDCSVKLTVNDEYVIHRSKKPGFLKFFKGDKDITRDSVRNTQAFIEETLHTNYKVFLASSVFGQQNNMEFITATPDDKRTIIKNFLNLEELFSLRESVKRLKSEYSQKIRSQDAIIAEHEKSVRSFDYDLQQINTKDYNYSVEDMNITLEEILELEQTTRDTEALINRAMSRKLLVLHDLEQLVLGQIKYCEECDRAFDPISEKEVNKGIKKDHVELDELDNKIAQLSSYLPSIPISSQEYTKVQEYKQLKTQEETFAKLKEETLVRIQEAHDIKQEFNSKYEIMRFWEKAFSEQGIVKYIIKNVLSYFNSKVNFYLAHLSQGKFIIEFDEQLKETVTHRKNVIPFVSLSGGEKKKVNLAVMLGLQELLKISHKEKNNLMFLDEVAESLDNEGLDGLYTLLSELKKDKTLFVITHNNYLKSLMDNSRTITMIKSNGITKVVGK